MKKIAVFLCGCVLFWVSIIDAHASDNDTIQSFKLKIDSICNQLSINPSQISISKRLSGKKIKITGTFDGGSKNFKHKIKYVGDIKKEMITVKYNRSEKPCCYLKIVLIDEEYFYIKNITYVNEQSNKKIAIEKLVDGKIYLKIFFNARGAKQIAIWDMNKE